MTEFHTITVNVEVYVHDREMPLNWPLRLDVPETMVDMSDIMSSAFERVRTVLEPHIVLVDERASHHLVYKKDIQALSLQAPDESQITWGDSFE